MEVPPLRVLSPQGRFVIWGGKMHVFYIKNGKMSLPPTFRKIHQSNGRLAIYKS